MAQPTAQEVLFLALINRARLDPTGEAARYPELAGNINEGPVRDLNTKAIITLTGTSKQPLAWNDALSNVAIAHTQDMFAQQRLFHDDWQVHQSKLTAAGYSFGRWAENVSQQPLFGTIDVTQSVYLEHQALFVDTFSAERGHRANILHEDLQEVGIAHLTGNYKGTTSTLTTQDFGKPSVGTQFLTGLTFNDTVSANSFYDVGEARGGVTVTTTAGNVVSGAAGAFSKAISAGVQTISFSGAGLPQTVSAEITVTAGRNALVDLIGTSTLETSVSLKALSGVIKIIGLGNIGLTLTGNNLDNTIVSALGSDTINGAEGTDTVVYSGNLSAYVINTNVATGVTTVSRNGITDTLALVEKLQFGDQTITIGAPANKAPTVAVADQTLASSAVVNLSPLVAYSDPDGNPATQFQIIDNGTAANSGQLIAPNGTVVAAGTTLTVSAADLANVKIKGGSVAGTDGFQIRAFDGTAWSAWDAFNVTTNAPVNTNTAPVATIDDKSLNVNQWVKLSDLVNYSDGDGNPAVQYQFIDLFSANGSAYFWNNGTVQAGNQVFTVNAADLANVWVRGAQAGGWENMQVRAFDGKDWGAWDTFKITTQPNAAAVATIDDKIVRPNASLKVSDIVKYADANGDAAVQYQIVDLYDGAGSAHLLNNGTVVAANQTITVNAADLAKITVKGGTGSGWDNMQIRAYDGKEWGAWDTFKVTTNKAAVATINDKAVSINEWVQLSSILKTTDADGDAIKEYQFIDKFAADGSAYFWFNGTLPEAGKSFTVKAADLASVWVRGAEVAGWENMQVRANDGNGWGSWDNFKFTTIDNHAPTVTVANKSFATNIDVLASKLFKATDIDAPAGDKIVAYEFWDGNSNASTGHFEFNGVDQKAGVAIRVAVADIGKMIYETGTAAGAEQLSVRAFDGDTWSDWMTFNATTVV